MSDWDVFAEVSGILTEMGGPGSGHHGHKGRKGKRGGSTRSGAGGRVSRSVEDSLSSYLFNEHRKDIAADLDSQLNGALREYGSVAGSPVTETDVDRILVYGSFVDKDVEFPGDIDMVVQIKSQSPSVPGSKYGVNAKIWPQEEKSIPMLFTQNEGVFDAIKETVEAGVTGGPSVAVQVYSSETTKSNFIIPQIESQLALSPEGGWEEKGGPGSGHWGHKGRKGKRGGSTRRGAGARPTPSDAVSFSGKLYHNTSLGALPAIQEEGLKVTPEARIQDAVYFLRSPSRGAAGRGEGALVSVDIDDAKLAPTSSVLQNLFSDVTEETRKEKYELPFSKREEFERIHNAHWIHNEARKRFTAKGYDGYEQGYEVVAITNFDLLGDVTVE